MATSDPGSSDDLTVDQAAAILGVTPGRVRGLLTRDALPGRRVDDADARGARNGKRQGWLIPAAAVEELRASGVVGTVPDRRRDPDLPLPELRALSFFSGAMGLDLGLERAGIEVLLACEFDRACRLTITENRPEIGLIGDIWAYDADEIRAHAGLGPDDTIDVMVGGPPCQAFSTAGARKGFNDERGNTFLRYVDLILELRPRFAVIENVRGLLSAAMVHTPHSERGPGWEPAPEERPGGALMHVIEMLRADGYGVSFNLYNAANFGVPQSRERVILLCSRDGEVMPHLMPTHAEHGRFDLPAWRTLRDALDGLDAGSGDHMEFPEDRLRFYRMLGPGQYWKHLPKELHREALGASLDSGGGKTGFYRRLAWDRPSCTLVTSPTMPATDICHPEEDRPLSVQEYARIQQFPDDWRFSGSLTERYRQIGNAVPVGLGEAVGRAVLAHLAGERREPPEGFPFSRYRATDERSWEERTRAVMSGAVQASTKGAARGSAKGAPLAQPLQLFPPVDESGSCTVEAASA